MKHLSEASVLFQCMFLIQSLFTLDEHPSLKHPSASNACFLFNFYLKLVNVLSETPLLFQCMFLIRFLPKAVICLTKAIQTVRPHPIMIKPMCYYSTVFVLPTCDLLLRSLLLRPLMLSFSVFPLIHFLTLPFSHLLAFLFFLSSNGMSR